MESWLVDVKRVRIPRPKFGGGASAAALKNCCPMEPPKDYGKDTDERLEEKLRKVLEGGSSAATALMAKITDDFREKL